MAKHAIAAIELFKCVILTIKSEVKGPYNVFTNFDVGKVCHFWCPKEMKSNNIPSTSLSVSPTTTPSTFPSTSPTTSPSTSPITSPTTSPTTFFYHQSNYILQLPVQLHSPTTSSINIYYQSNYILLLPVQPLLPQVHQHPPNTSPSRTTNTITTVNTSPISPSNIRTTSLLPVRGHPLVPALQPPSTSPAISPTPPASPFNNKPTTSPIAPQFPTSSSST
ncbi:hypothetical protein LOTGIDRAFT_161236 [Lottia gigantea]|uniref:Uncharacterized protein n=1 Tax=Lottia gigantea TaxID=225164 RepID=V4ALR7_LOTGI|nr:hypothetical protein LOTGIDRAFT_161236 [Lottia gigantea]ESO94536.1 hypothetical protein LOTGIDRAFT_161236 [Lottia gigantea]